jgi:hypothetical protein
MGLTAAEVWKDGRWQPLDGFFQGPNGVVIFGDKRAIVRGGIGFDVIDDEAAAARLKGLGAVPVPTTMAVPPPGGPGAVPVPAPPTNDPMPAAPRPMPVPGFGPGGVGPGTTEVLLPDGSVVGGVVFIRFTLDQSMMSPDAVLTLGESS